jgi:glutamate synthase (NADPH/NADH) small chain
MERKASAQERLPVKERICGFHEITKGVRPQWAMAEARRCKLCNDAPCMRECPAGVDVARFIRRIGSRNFRGALKVIRERNVLAGICARVCPQRELCEAGCSTTGLEETIGVGALQRFVADVEREKGKLRAPAPREKKGQTVAVVGSGPAGLSCAAELARMGYAVTIFEKDSRPGGIMATGIPPYRLPRDVLDWEIEFVKALGVAIRLGEPVEHVDSLRSMGFDGVFLGLGLGEPIRLSIPGEDMEGVIPGLDFLKEVHGALHEKREPPRLPGRITVIGGGNAALDSASTALRLGADQVQVLYRRSEKEMPAWPEERELAREEGVAFHFLVSPVAFLGEAGRLRSIRCVRMVLSEPDASGRPRPLPVEGSEFTVEADCVLPALGQQRNKSIEAMVPGIRLDRRGFPLVDGETLESSVPGVFLGGDLINGGTTVVQAVGEGRKAAAGIDRFLSEGGRV